MHRPGRWLVLLRAALVVATAVAVGLTSLPASYRPWGWAVVGFFAVETALSGVLSVTELGRAARVRARAFLIVCDAIVAIGVVAVFSYQADQPYRALYLIPIAEAALRFGLVGGVLGGGAMVGATIVIDALGPGVQWRDALVRVLVGMLAGIVVGRLRDAMHAERRLAEARAVEAERLLEELRGLSQLRADFVSLVSHELRSPMAAVIGAARTLQDRWRLLTEAQRESFLALIGDETARLAALVGDVLDTSRIEAGTFSYRFEDVDLVRLVEDAIEAVRLAQREIPVVTSMPPSLPAIRGDRGRLRQVFANLIDNAVKYSPEGGEVRVTASSDDGALRIAVRDEGPGIPLDQQARIFEKFGRVDLPGASKPGTGLGLFIARSIAEAHGGTLEVTSGPEPGSTFTLTLPAGG
jgi:signal transduction histidine kinase